jgi:hypothetical protein
VPAEGKRSEIASLTTGTTVTSTDELFAPAAEEKLRAPSGVILGTHEGWEAALVAVIVTFVEEVTDGAVKRPVLVIEPALAVHTTAVSGVDVRVARNC